MPHTSPHKILWWQELRASREFAQQLTYYRIALALGDGIATRVLRTKIQHIFKRFSPPMSSTRTQTWPWDCSCLPPPTRVLGWDQSPCNLVITIKPRASGAPQPFTPTQGQLNTSVPFPNPMKVVSAMEHNHKGLSSNHRQRVKLAVLRLWLLSKWPINIYVLPQSDPFLLKPKCLISFVHHKLE